MLSFHSLLLTCTLAGVRGERVDQLWMQFTHSCRFHQQKYDRFGVGAGAGKVFLTDLKASQSLMYPQLFLGAWDRSRAEPFYSLQRASFPLNLMERLLLRVVSSRGSIPQLFFFFSSYIGVVHEQMIILLPRTSTLPFPKLRNLHRI